MGKYTVRTGEPGQELFRGPPERAPILGQKWVQNRAPFGGLPAQDGPKWGGFPLRTAGFFNLHFPRRALGRGPRGSQTRYLYEDPGSGGWGPGPPDPILVRGSVAAAPHTGCSCYGATSRSSSLI